MDTSGGRKSEGMNVSELLPQCDLINQKAMREDDL
jgi:hypothetical protein